jgi:hypothetical protein
LKLPTKLFFILITFIFLELNHYIAVLAHEYGHSITAWILGFKHNPLIIHFGGTGWLNLLTLININEFVDYQTIFSLGKGKQAALIAFAGPGIANGVLYIISLVLLADRSVQKRPKLFYFFFWMNFLNLANFYDYVPIRVFSPQGDMAHIVTGLHISPWLIYFVFGYFVMFVLWHFYTRTLVAAYVHLGFVKNFPKIVLMTLCTLLLFGYFGLAGFVDNGDISHFLSGTSFLLIPAVIAFAWPAREWVIRAMDAY